MRYTSIFILISTLIVLPACGGSGSDIKQPVTSVEKTNLAYSKIVNMQQIGDDDTRLFYNDDGLFKLARLTGSGTLLQQQEYRLPTGESAGIDNLFEMAGGTRILATNYETFFQIDGNGNQTGSGYWSDYNIQGALLYATHSDTGFCMRSVSDNADTLYCFDDDLNLLWQDSVVTDSFYTRLGQHLFLTDDGTLYTVYVDGNASTYYVRAYDNQGALMWQTEVSADGTKTVGDLTLIDGHLVMVIRNRIKLPDDSHQYQLTMVNLDLNGQILNTVVHNQYINPPSLIGLEEKSAPTILPYDQTSFLMHSLDEQDRLRLFRVKADGQILWQNVYEGSELSAALDPIKIDEQGNILVHRETYELSIIFPLPLVLEAITNSLFSHFNANGVLIQEDLIGRLQIRNATDSGEPVTVLESSFITDAFALTESGYVAAGHPYKYDRDYSDEYDATPPLTLNHYAY